MGLNLPEYWFSDVLVPPLTNQRAQNYDPNKCTAIPILKDAVVDISRPQESMHFKYPITSANRNTILRPLSTCLPVGLPNRVANLQDLCSSIIPFAIQSQQYLRARKKPARKTLKKPNNPNAKGGKSTYKSPSIMPSSESDESDDSGAEMDEDFGHPSNSEQEEEEDDEQNGLFGTGRRKPEKESNSEEQERIRVDPLLPFSDLPCLPHPVHFKPHRRDKARIEVDARRAAIYCSVRKVEPLKSPLNWWYSGGAMSYLKVSTDQGCLLHPAASLTVLDSTFISPSTKRSFHLVKATGEKLPETQLQDSIYQIVTQNVGDETGLVCVRLPYESVLLQMKYSDEQPQLEIKKSLKPTEPDHFLSHVSASPYIFGEFLTATQQGDVKLWNVERDEALCGMNIRGMGFGKLARYPWVGCYFGSYPRSICIATPSGIEIFDGRIRNGKAAQLVLLSKGNYVSGVENDIVAADTFAADSTYHTAMTTKEFLLIDERFPKNPALRYPQQCSTPALYLRSAKSVTATSGCIFTGSQMAQTAMCYEVDTSTDVKPISLASLPFCTATSRQLIPLASMADIHVDFTMRQRLEKPIIGMEVISQPDGTGVTLATLSALGDVFLQSFETVNKDEYEPDGVAAFSTTHSSFELTGREKTHLKSWLNSSTLAVADPTTRNYLQLYHPADESCVSENVAEFMLGCSAAVKNVPHPQCRRCNPKKHFADGEENIEDLDALCLRCRAVLRSCRERCWNRPTNRFCFFEENNHKEHFPILDSLKRRPRLREMALTNRIVHRILTKCYHEDIPSAAHELQSLHMPPPPEKKTRKTKTTEQTDRIQALLDDANKEYTLENSVQKEPMPCDEDEYDAVISGNLLNNMFHDGENVDEVVAELPMSLNDILPLATSTQRQLAEEPSTQFSDTANQSAKKKKMKRMSGF